MRKSQAKSITSLPIYPEPTDDEVDWVIKEIIFLDEMNK